MIGYVKNVSPVWTHALKRAVRPGGEIELDELYEQYGLKHDIPEGKEFIDWLRKVKLKDTERWKIVYDDGTKAVSPVELEEKEVVKKEVTNTDTGVTKKHITEHTSPIVPKGMSVSDVTGLSVRKAREVLSNITDLKLLKYALQEASTLTGKDSLCRVIRSRLKQIEIAR